MGKKISELEKVRRLKPQRITPDEFLKLCRQGGEIVHLPRGHFLVSGIIDLTQFERNGANTFVGGPTFLGSAE